MTGPDRVSTAGADGAEEVSHILRRKSRDVLVLVVAVALLGPILLLTQYVLSQQANTIYTPVVETTDSLEIAMSWAQSDLRTDRASILPGAANQLAARQRESRLALEELQRLVGDDPEFAPTLDRMTSAAQSWWRYADSVVGTTPAPGEVGARDSLARNAAALTTFNVLLDSTDSLHDTAIEKREVIRTWRNAILVGGSVLAIAAILGVSIMIVRDTRRTAALIATPIEELDRMARSDAGGGRGTRSTANRGPAEIRALAAAFNDLLDTRDQYERGRDEYVRRLEELDRQKDDFLSTVSHELRTPLASIIGYSELLEDGDAGELSGQQLHLMSVIRRNADRLRGLIENLLVLSRIEGRGLEIDHSRVELGAVVTGVVESLEPQVTGSGVTLRADLVAVDVEGDALQLERAVTNLVSNAIKFTPEGGEVDVRLTTDCAMATVEVADTGIGIPAAEQEHLGTRFFRSSTAQSGSIPGTGLGLSIVHAIADSHGGRLTFDSTEDEGTAFRLTIPLWDESTLTDEDGCAVSSP
ncbi:MAG: HAMP domain-containing sensor histidine kinase [Dietzia psychralcaliphila]